ncbi:hypothetical protein V6N13_046264 [Hibiscus sabdariffa]|uniref:Uncharacterized protein n=1 Tax=Hibiscus sabdariffa TaxID=183260 RepID=A0ABR2D9L4_9ROSI
MGFSSVAMTQPIKMQFESLTLLLFHMLPNILASVPHTKSSIESQPPQERSEQPTKNLPHALVMKPPPLLTLFEDKFISTKIQLLKVWGSTLPLDQFLTTYPGSVQAVLYFGASPITPHIIQLLPFLQLVVTAMQASITST